MQDNSHALAEHYFEIGRYEAAIEALKSEPMLLDRSEDQQKHVLLVDILLAKGDIKPARELAEQLLSMYPDDPLVKEAFIQVTVKDRSLAPLGTRLCQSMLAVDDSNPRLWFLLAKLGFFFRTIDDESVLEATAKAVEFGEGSANILAVAHLIFVNLGAKSAGENCVSRLAGLSPDSDATYESIAHHFARLGHFRELAQVCLDGLVAYPQNEVLLAYIEEAADRLYMSPLDRVVTWPVRAIRIRPTSLARWGTAYRHRFQFYWWHLRATVFPLLALIVVLPATIIGCLCMSHHMLVSDSRRRFRLRQTDALYPRLIPSPDVCVDDGGDGWLLWNSGEQVLQNILRLTPQTVVFAQKTALDIEESVQESPKNLAEKRSQHCSLQHINRWSFRDNEVTMIPRFRAPGKPRQYVTFSDPDSMALIGDWLAHHGFKQTSSGPVALWRLWGRATIVVPLVALMAIALILIGNIWTILIGLVIALNLIDRVYYTFRYRPSLTVFKRDKTYKHARKETVSNELFASRR